MARIGMVLAALLAAAPGQDPQKEKLKQGLKDTEVRGDWIYDDVDAGFAAAGKNGKPLMFVFR